MNLYKLINKELKPDYSDAHYPSLVCGDDTSVSIAPHAMMEAPLIAYGTLASSVGAVMRGDCGLVGVIITPREQCISSEEDFTIPALVVFICSAEALLRHMESADTLQYKNKRVLQRVEREMTKAFNQCAAADHAHVAEVTSSVIFELTDYSSAVYDKNISSYTGTWKNHLRPAFQNPTGKEIKYFLDAKQPSKAVYRWDAEAARFSVFIQPDKYTSVEGLPTLDTTVLKDKSVPYGIVRRLVTGDCIHGSGSKSRLPFLSANAGICRQHAARLEHARAEEPIRKAYLEVIMNTVWPTRKPSFAYISRKLYSSVAIILGTKYKSGRLVMRKLHISSYSGAQLQNSIDEAKMHDHSNLLQDIVKHIEDGTISDNSDFIMYEDAEEISKSLRVYLLADQLG